MQRVDLKNIRVGHGKTNLVLNRLWSFTESSHVEFLVCNRVESFPLNASGDS